MDLWKENRILYGLLSVCCIIHNEYFISILLFIIPNKVYYYVKNWVNCLRYDYYRISFSLLASFITIFQVDLPIYLLALGILLSPHFLKKMFYYSFFGFFSDYKYGHISGLILIHQLYELFIDNKI